MFEAIVIIGLVFGLIGASNEGLNEMKGVKENGDVFCVKVHDTQSDQMKIEILKQCK